MVEETIGWMDGWVAEQIDSQKMQTWMKTYE